MRWRSLAAAGCLLAFASTARGQEAVNPAPSSPDARALQIEQSMTEDERFHLTHGMMALPVPPHLTLPPGAVPAAGYVEGVARLGVPALTETDAGLGVAYARGARKDPGATALPSGLASAATFDPAIAYAEGSMIGQEAWRSGFNVLLGVGDDLARDPRNGRNFEYFSEDPLLAGTLAGETIRGIQDQHVISALKHFAFNDQETGRHVQNVVIGEAAARESDLLAFEIAIERGRPGAVMCSYNRFNGPYACDSDVLLNQVLKRDWKFPGWVMSDWSAVPSLDSALNGLDQESAAELDTSAFFDRPLRAAVQEDSRYRDRLADMNRRILRSMLAVDLFDHPPVITPIDFKADGEVARRAAEQGIVLLINRDNILPLAKAAQTIAVIGGHSDAGVLSGGGSTQVVPPGGPSAVIALGGDGPAEQWHRQVFFTPPSPLAAIRAADPAARVRFDDGAYPSAAAKLAASADLAIVFVTQWMTEGADAPDISLPQGQDELIQAVAAANPHTIVVLETGGPVLMPWLGEVGAVVEAWYPGARGGDAIAGVLFGDVDPSGRLPITFPASLDQLPRPDVPGWTEMAASFDVTSDTTAPSFDVDDNIEGSDVGYRWYARKAIKPLFPFGYGLSYTQFSQDHLEVTGGDAVTVSVSVTNTGEREGIDTPQVYLTSGPQGPRERLLGFSRVDLKPHETKEVTLSVDPRLLADWDSGAHDWSVRSGTYTIAVGRSAEDIALSASTLVNGRTLNP